MRAVLVGAALLGAGVLAGRLHGDLRTVPRDVRPPAAPPTVSVVVPARDEAATLPRLLASLAALTTRPAEVVVVDDASRDGTAAVARAGGAVVVLTDGPPTGWTGKAWACQQGAAATTGELLLFLDADTELAPDALDGLLALHTERGGLISVQPFHAVERPYEQLSSYFNGVSLLASGAFADGSVRRPGRPMAFGPCLLTSRADYERAGGHAAVRDAILDDVALAAAYARVGLPVRCAVGDGAVRMRMYPAGPAQLAEGWTKNFVSGATAAAPGPSLTAAGWVAAHHAVAVGAGLSLARGHHRRLLLWLLAWVGTALQLRGLLRRIGSFHAWTWAAFPVPLLAFDALFARSALRTLVHRSVRWRGRDVPIPGPRERDA